MTISRRLLSRICRSAGSLSTPWVAQRTSRSRPRARGPGRSPSSVPPVSISSSTMIAACRATSPMTFMSSARSRLPKAPLLDRRQWRVDQLGEAPRALGEPEVGHDDHVVEVLVDGSRTGDHRHRGQLVDRDVEEALDLALVKVHGEDAVGAGDRVMSAMRRAVIGTRAGPSCRCGRKRVRMTAVIRPGRRALAGIDHDQQLHDRLVDGTAFGWTTYTSRSRTFSWILTKMFSLANSNTSALPSSRSEVARSSCAPGPGWRCRVGSNSSRVPGAAFGRLSRRVVTAAPSAVTGLLPDPDPPLAGSPLSSMPPFLRQPGAEHGDPRRPDRPASAASRSRPVRCAV